MKKNNFIRKIVIKNSGKLIINFVLSGLLVSLMLLLPRIIKYIVDSLNTLNKKQYLILTVLYVLISFIIYIISVLKKYNEEILSWKIANELREKLLRRFLSYDSEFFHHYAIGNIMQFFEADIQFVNEFIAGTMSNFIINILMIVLVLYSFFQYSVSLGSIFSVLIIIIIASTLIYEKKNSDIVSEERDFYEKLCGLYGEWITEAKEIKVLGKSEYVYSVFVRKYREEFVKKSEVQKFLYMIWCIALSFGIISNYIVLLGGGILYAQGSLTIGEVYLLYSYSNKLKEPMEEFRAHLQATIKFISSLKRIHQIAAYSVKVKEGDYVLKDIKSIELKNLSLSYDDKIILNNVNYRFETDSSYGLYGISGAGKSSICKLIIKQYPVSDSMIFINEIDINTIQTECIKNRIAYLSNKSQIFSATLAENITMFRGFITKDNIKKYMDYYGIWDLFHFRLDEDPLNTYIAEDCLSVGEKQIINLCRLFFLDKDVIIFDEATSDVDIKIEEEYFRILFRICEEKKCCLIVISHDLTRLRKCSHLVQCSDSRLLEVNKENIYGIYQ